MLEVLGIDPEAGAAYRALVSLPTASAAELAEVLGESVTRCAQLLATLEASGLAARSSASPDGYVASPPQVALGALVARRQDDLREAEVQLGVLTELYRVGSAGRTLTDVVDVVLGPDALRQRIGQLQSGARREVLAFVRSGVVVTSRQDNLEEDRALQRGVGFRVVVERAVAQSPGFLASARDAAEVGEEIRIVRNLPTRMILVDGDIALLPMSSEDGGAIGGLLVHRSGLLDGLLGLFEMTWATAAPITPRPGSDAATGTAEVGLEVAAPGEDLGHPDTMIIALLRAGLTDQAISGQLGLSIRSVQRRVRGLMDRAGVDTRFQLGLEAGRRGWGPGRTAQRTTV